MAKKLRFHPLASNDFEKAAAWYDERSPNVGHRFRIAVKRGFVAVKTAPEQWGKISEIGDLRSYRVGRFPYVILYRIARDYVVVVGLYHAASDPASWQDRTEGA